MIIYNLFTNWMYPFVPHLGVKSLSLGGIFLLQGPNVFVPAGGKAGEGPKDPDDQEEEGGSGPLPCAEDPAEKAPCLLAGHEGLKDPVHQHTSQQVSHRDSEKLEGVPGGVDPALKLHPGWRS